VAGKLPKGYKTKLPSGMTYGEGLLQKSNIYATFIATLLDRGVDIHYLSNITGHGMRKIMRSQRAFTYHVQQIVEPPEIFPFIQQHAELSDEEIYGTYNMGTDYAIFLPKSEVSTVKRIVKSQGFECIDAGYIEKGERKVVIEPLNITFSSDSLALKSQ
jgi:phosphoribosylformylglycinamidine cyclo-ligase